MTRKKPADQANQDQAFENAQHRRVQQQIRDIVQVDAVRTFCRTAHHQVRQNRRRKLERPEPYRQRQTKPGAGAVSDTGAFRHCGDNRHQQRNTSHIRRHHKRQRIAQQHHARYH